MCCIFHQRYTHDCPIIAVGFHRYVLENFKGDTLDGVKETEVTEFDAASEVGGLKFAS